MSGELTLLMAFATGLFGALHCLGMCGGLAGGYFAQRRLAPDLAAQIAYHASRLTLYLILGAGGAWAGRVLAQSGWVGKGQGLLMIGTGLLILALGLRMALAPWRRPTPSASVPPVVRLEPRIGSQRPWAPLLLGTLNGLVPCSLVFSVAIKAATLGDPGRAALFMLAFGLGTLPMMVAVTWTGAFIGARVRRLATRLAGGLVALMGLWTLYEGYLFFDIMRGLANG